MGYILFWFLMSFVCWVLAARYNRRPAVWALIGLLLGMFGPVVLLAYGPLPKKDFE